MTRLLRGNYELDIAIDAKDGGETGATTEFEKKALSRLGGSICVVSKKGLLWRGDGAGGTNACG